MSQPADAGNVGIYGSAVGGLATSGATWADVINTNAMFIGILLTVVSLAVGIVFKVLHLRQRERHHREELAAQKKENEALTAALRSEIRGLRPPDT
jgi:hypothetical protein